MIIEIRYVRNSRGSLSICRKIQPGHVHISQSYKKIVTRLRENEYFCTKFKSMVQISVNNRRKLATHHRIQYESTRDLITCIACRHRTVCPLPTGRMHLGNLFSALMSWLSVKSRGGRWILRIEDLDPQRSKQEYSRLIEDDLSWLGLDWDEGGLADRGPHGPYSQSRRGEIYADYLAKIENTGYTYPCSCTRADIMATQAPHQSDGRVIYGGRCRPATMPRPASERNNNPGVNTATRYSTRLYVPDEEIGFTDKVYGLRSVNLTHECGDFILRRADGAWAYQLAVVVDDALMGVTEVVRERPAVIHCPADISLPSARTSGSRVRPRAVDMQQ